MVLTLPGVGCCRHARALQSDSGGGRGADLEQGDILQNSERSNREVAL
jgi:hypothetical protein